MRSNLQLIGHHSLYGSKCLLYVGMSPSTEQEVGGRPHTCPARDEPLVRSFVCDAPPCAIRTSSCGIARVFAQLRLAKAKHDALARDAGLDELGGDAALGAIVLDPDAAIARPSSSIVGQSRRWTR